MPTLMKYRYLHLFFLSIAFVTQCFAQTDTWQAWEPLYSDSYIQVEIQFKIPAGNSCAGGRPIKYQYRVLGKYRSGAYFLSWKLDYIDCNGDLYYKWNSVEIGKSTADDISSWQLIESMDYQFPAQSLEVRHYDETASYTPQTGVGTKTLQYSKPPDRIEGTKKIHLGEATDLNVKGGSLGIGASWIWRRDSCNGPVIGRGSPLRIEMNENTRVFVRAEGKNNTTRCVATIVEVDQRSQAPVGIKTRSKICKGESITLSVDGGSLGLDAEWVWYRGSCGSQKLGTGNRISVTPIQETTYYVRAEGKLNTTACTSQTVSVYNKSTDPISISASHSNICEGQALTLSVKGGSLAGDAAWQWYAGGCGGSTIGKGTTVALNPSSSTTYFVRGEGVCNNTNCISRNINVDRKISSAGSILVSPTLVYKGKKTTLSVGNSSLNGDANLRWYKGSCSGQYIGSGNSIEVRPRSATTYFVKAIGQCNETNCVHTTITPVRMHNRTRSYRNKRQSLHWGFGAGLEWMQLQAPAKFTSPGDTFATSIRVTGIGIPVEVVFHPVFKEYFTLGLSGGAAYGVSTAILKSNSTTGSNSTTDHENLSYFRWNYGAELAFGFRKIKFLANLNRMTQYNEYELITPSNQGKYTFDQRLNQEILGFGLRFGRYLKTDKKIRKNFDLLYTLTQQSFSGSPDFSFDNLSKRAQGFSIAYWKHNRCKFRTDLVVSTDDDFESFNWDWNKAYVQVAFILSLDRFY